MKLLITKKIKIMNEIKESEKNISLKNSELQKMKRQLSKLRLKEYELNDLILKKSNNGKQVITGNFIGKIKGEI